MHLQAVRGAAGAAAGDRVVPSSSDPVPGVLPPGAQPKPVPGPASRSSFAFKSPKKAAAQNPGEPGFKHADGCVTPECAVVHSGSLDLTDAWADSAVHAPPTVPQALVIRVELPGLVSAASVDLDIDKRQLELLVPLKFRLDVQLPFEVQGSKAKAKFDTRKQQLAVTVPVVPPPAPARQPRQQPDLMDSQASGSCLVQELPGPSPPGGKGEGAAEVGAPAAVGEAEPGPESSEGTAHALGTAADDLGDAELGAEAVPEAEATASAASEGLAAEDVASAEQSLEAATGNSELLAAAAKWQDQHQARDAADRPPAQALASTALCSEAGARDVPAAEQKASTAGPASGGGSGMAHGAVAPKVEMALDFDFVDELD